jgi:hypothetical protein
MLLPVPGWLGAEGRLVVLRCANVALCIPASLRLAYRVTWVVSLVARAGAVCGVALRVDTFTVTVAVGLQ